MAWLTEDMKNVMDIHEGRKVIKGGQMATNYVISTLVIQDPQLHHDNCPHCHTDFSLVFCDNFDFQAHTFQIVDFRKPTHLRMSQIAK